MAVLESLWPTVEQAKQLGQYAADKPTEEICGLFFGSASNTVQQPPVTQIIPIENIAANPADRYEMHPVQLVAAQMTAVRNGLELIGIYHSHPQSHPIPSETDISESRYPDAVYLIISPGHSDARFAAWSIDNGEVKSVPLHIGHYPPPNALNEPELSRSQKTAIVLSALLAVAFLLVVSFTLLPPAPPLPN